MHEGIIFVFTWCELGDATTMTLQYTVMVGFHVVSDIMLQLCHIVEGHRNLKLQPDYRGTDTKFKSSLWNWSIIIMPCWIVSFWLLKATGGTMSVRQRQRMSTLVNQECCRCCLHMVVKKAQWHKGPHIKPVTENKAPSACNVTRK